METNKLEKYVTAIAFGIAVIVFAWMCVTQKEVLMELQGQIKQLDNKVVALEQGINRNIVTFIKGNMIEHIKNSEEASLLLKDQIKLLENKVVLFEKNINFNIANISQYDAINITETQSKIINDILHAEHARMSKTTYCNNKNMTEAFLFGSTVTIAGFLIPKLFFMLGHG